ncbi:helix-turn-helix domain-containing protein [Polaromonas sp. OV174]|uniref:helix-turn-helix domain-containing protein n=1 Tax=Polaromonas sp. OV174 TaxID=1855300 RepID=UPI000B89F4C7|nr:helix-turn-helix transcriptional regulator [Polaromonas sp. OV174]
MITNKTIGARIREERKRLCLTQQQFADSLSMSRSCLALYETDRTVPDLNFGRRAKENGLDAWYIMTGERSSTAAEQLFDWASFTGILSGIRSFCADQRLEITIEKEIAVARVLYKLSLDRAMVDQDVMNEMLRLAA